jgi:hypothetical protein
MHYVWSEIISYSALFCKINKYKNERRGILTAHLQVRQRWLIPELVNWRNPWTKGSVKKEIRGPAEKLETRRPIGICGPNCVRDDAASNLPTDPWNRGQDPVCPPIHSGTVRLYWTLDSTNPETSVQAVHFIFLTLPPDANTHVPLFLWAVPECPQPPRPGLWGRGSPLIRVLMDASFCF